MAAPSVITFDHVTRDYSGPTGAVRALDQLCVEVHSGSVVAVMGPSGSGKSTFLNLAVGLERPTSGKVLFLGQNTSDCTEDELADIRARHVGFIFQDFHLLPGLTAVENVMLPLEILGRPKPRQAATALLARVGLAERHAHYPYQLSGGEQQRVAIARAYVHRPQLLLADEPTGNLDFETGTLVTELLFELNREHNSTLMLATHDRELAAKASRCLQLRGGKLLHDAAVTSPR